MFEHRPAYLDDLQDKYSQQGELGPNHDNDCVPATFSNIMHAYGYRHTKPSWWDAGTYPAGYLGPTSYAAMVAFMKNPANDFPNAPDVRISNPVDTLAAIDAAGKAGFAIAFNGWSDASGNFQNHKTPILHVAAVTTIYPDGSVVVLNPEHNKLEQFGAADFRAITAGTEAGWLAIFARALPLPAPPAPVPPPAPIPVDPVIVALRSQLALAQTALATEKLSSDGLRLQIATSRTALAVAERDIANALAKVIPPA